eukprot:14254053-Heterocapsa_arctica.AAC.1
MAGVLSGGEQSPESLHPNAGEQCHQPLRPERAPRREKHAGGEYRKEFAAHKALCPEGQLGKGQG